MNLTNWVRVKKKRPERRVMLRFLEDFPEGLMGDNGPVGPIKKGDLITLELVGKETAGVLIERDFVEVYIIE